MPLVGGKGHCTGRQTTSHKRWRCGTTSVCRTGWRSPTLDRSGFAGLNIFAPWGTENPRAVLRAFPRVAGGHSPGPLRERLRKAYRGRRSAASGVGY